MPKQCEHCGSDHILDTPPGCPTCGAPQCCQVCCKIDTLEDCLKKSEGHVYCALRWLARKRRKGVFWAVVTDALGVGSTTAHFLCRKHGLDPDTGKPLPEAPQ